MRALAVVLRTPAAQQEAERAKYVVLKARQDKKSIIIKAQGEAKSAEMIGACAAAVPAEATMVHTANAPSCPNCADMCPTWGRRTTCYR